MSQHITLLQAQSEYYLNCSSSQEFAAAGTYAYIGGERRGCLVVNAATVTGTPTLLLYYRPAGAEDWSATGVAVTLSGTDTTRGDFGSLPAGMTGLVELSLWSAGTGGEVYPLSVAVIVTE